jgi:hypothetical protein
MKRKRMNALTSGFTGVFDNQVAFRIRRGKEELCKVPEKRPGKGTPAQQVARARLIAANLYYRRVKSNPELLAFYKAALTIQYSVHNLCVSDFCHVPEIGEVDTSGYHGQQGEQIVIQAGDNFMVCRVTVAVYDTSGKLMETADAVQRKGKEQWVFTAGCFHGIVGRVVVTAVDLPGNETVREISFT